MRGKADRHSRSRSDQGITPAYAGKSLLHLPHLRWGWDHPRLCGEKLAPLVRAYSILGSPPPMRGKVLHSPFRFPCSRITPAYAGKSAEYVLFYLKLWDHPRLCGEKCAEPSIVVTIQGSPPPMRGKVRAVKTMAQTAGITPAYAGKSDKQKSNDSNS